MCMCMLCVCNVCTCVCSFAYVILLLVDHSQLLKACVLGLTGTDPDLLHNTRNRKEGVLCIT